MKAGWTSISRCNRCWSSCYFTCHFWIHQPGIGIKTKYVTSKVAIVEVHMLQFHFLMRYGTTVKPPYSNIIKHWVVKIYLYIVIIFIGWLSSYVPKDFVVSNGLIVIRIILLLLGFGIKIVGIFIEFRVYHNKHAFHVCVNIIVIT